MVAGAIKVPGAMASPGALPVTGAHGRAAVNLPGIEPPGGPSHHNCNTHRASCLGDSEECPHLSLATLAIPARWPSSPC